MLLKRKKNENEDNEIGERWTKIDRRPKTRITIRGNKKMESTLKAANNTMDVYVGRCSIEVNCDLLKDYIEKEIGVPMVTCIELSKEPSQMKSFKVSVLSAHRDKLLDADKWPENIHVRKFVKPRNGRQI